VGLRRIPDRTTVGRWWRRYLSLLEETFKKIADILRLAAPTTTVVVDSTPLVDLYDMEAGWGYTSRGKFRGFKLHAAVNQLGLPLRAVVTPGNRYDSPFLPMLIEDLEAEYVLADAAYDSKKNIRAVESINAEPVFACNPRLGKRRRVKHVKLLRTRRYVVEQFNGHVKDNILDDCWTRPRDLIKKAAMVMAGLVSIDANAVRAIIEGETSLKSVSQYWD
jgi:transposase